MPWTWSSLPCNYFLVQNILNDLNPTNDGSLDASPLSSLSPLQPPPCWPLRPAILLIAHGAVMERHAVPMPSWSNVASTATNRTPHAWGQAHGTGATLAAATMPWLSLLQSALAADPFCFLGRCCWLGNSNTATPRPSPGAPSALKFGHATVIVHIAKRVWGW